MKWFRWHRGTVERSKFRIIALKASSDGTGGDSAHPERVDGAVSMTDVIAIWALILEDAANKDNWGFLSQDCRDIAVTLDLCHGSVTAVSHEMCVANMLEWDDKSSRYKIVNWEKYQYISDSKDPSAAERQRKSRDKKRHACVTRDVTQTLRPDTETDTDTETDKKEPPIVPPETEIPLWINPQDWKDFSEMRKKQKKPMTRRAEKSIIKKLEQFRSQGHDAATIIEQSIRNGWQDVYAPKDGKQGGAFLRQPSKSERARAAIIEGLSSDL